MRKLFMFVLVWISCIGVASCLDTRVGGKSVGQVFVNVQSRNLALAVCHGNDHAIDKLIEAGADVNATGYGGTSILMWGMECHSKSGVEELLKHHADVNYSIGGDGGMSAMWLATMSSDSYWLKMFIKYGGNVNDIYNGRNLLTGAITQDSKEKLVLLIKSGADVNEHKGGETAAEYAAGYSKYGLVELLLNNGYNYNLQGLANMVGFPAKDYHDGTYEIRSTSLLKRLASLGYVPDFHSSTLK